MERKKRNAIFSQLHKAPSFYEHVQKEDVAQDEEEEEEQVPIDEQTEQHIQHSQLQDQMTNSNVSNQLNYQQQVQQGPSINEVLNTQSSREEEEPIIDNKQDFEQLKLPQGTQLISMASSQTLEGLSPQQLSKHQSDLTGYHIQSKLQKKINTVGKMVAATQQDVSLYTHEKLLQEAIVVLKRKSKVRTNRDKQILIRCCQNLEFFKKTFGNDHKNMLKECVQYFQHKYLKKGDFVFKQGQLGDLFYIILQGTVRIWVSRQRVKDKEQANNQADGGTSVAGTAQGAVGKKGQKKEKMSIIDEIEEKIIIRDLSQGDSFGELALINSSRKPKPRSATIECLTDCDFITFDKESFDKILKNQEIIKIKEELERLKLNYLFKEFAGNTLQKIFFLFQIQKCCKDEIIYQENEPANKLYYIRDGEYLIQKAHYINRDNEKKNLLNRNEARSQKITLDIGILNADQCFGEEEFFINNATRQVSITCISTKGQLMVINKKDLYKKFGQDSQPILFLEKLSQKKQKWRQDQIQAAIQNYEKIAKRNNHHIYDKTESDSSPDSFEEPQTQKINILLPRNVLFATENDDIELVDDKAMQDRPQSVVLSFTRPKTAISSNQTKCYNAINRRLVQPLLQTEMNDSINRDEDDSIQYDSNDRFENHNTQQAHKTSSQEFSNSQSASALMFTKQHRIAQSAKPKSQQHFNPAYSLDIDNKYAKKVCQNQSSSNQKLITNNTNNNMALNTQLSTNSGFQDKVGFTKDNYSIVEEHKFSRDYSSLPTSPDKLEKPMIMSPQDRQGKVQTMQFQQFDIEETQQEHQVNNTSISVSKGLQKKYKQIQQIQTNQNQEENKNYLVEIEGDANLNLRKSSTYVSNLQSPKKEDQESRQLLLQQQSSQPKRVLSAQTAFGRRKKKQGKPALDMPQFKKCSVEDIEGPQFKKKTKADILVEKSKEYLILNQDKIQQMAAQQMRHKQKKSQLPQEIKENMEMLQKRIIMKSNYKNYTNDVRNHLAFDINNIFKSPKNCQIRTSQYDNNISTNGFNLFQHEMIQQIAASQTEKNEETNKKKFIFPISQQGSSGLTTMQMRQLLNPTTPQTQVAATQVSNLQFSNNRQQNNQQQCSPAAATVGFALQNNQDLLLPLKFQSQQIIKSMQNEKRQNFAFRKCTSYSRIAQIQQQQQIEKQQKYLNQQKVKLFILNSYNDQVQFKISSLHKINPRYINNQNYLKYNNIQQILVNVNKQ